MTATTTTTKHAPIAPTPYARPGELSAVLARLESIDANLTALRRRQEKTEELVAEMTPILREVMATATTKLDALERKGWFAFGRELAGVAERVVEGFRPDEVRELGDAVVGILRTVRALTQPRVLEVAKDASAVLENSESAEPLGLFGMVRATNDTDVQKGMAVMLDLLRHVGRAAEAVRTEKAGADPAAERKAKLAAALGPRRKKVEAAAPSPKPAVRPVPPRAASCAVPSTEGAREDWTPAVAEELARSLDLTLDEPRWAVVSFARADFAATKTSPNIRRLTQGTGLATKDLYALFPKAPARTVARIAGIPKPAGCI